MGSAVHYVPDVLGAYVTELGTYGLAPDTVKAQAGYLDRFGLVCRQEAADRGKRSPLAMAELDTGVVARYFGTCTGGPGNANNMLTPLRKWLEWAEMNGTLEPGRCARLLAGRRLRKAERAPKHYVPAEQFGTLLEVAGQRHPSSRMVMAAALYTLARRSELAGIRLRDIDLHGAEIQLYRKKRKRWTGVGICPELADELNDWLPQYASLTECVSAERMMRLCPDWKLIPRLAPVMVNSGGHFLKATQFTIDPENSPSHMEHIVKLGLDVTGAQTTDGIKVRHLGEGMHTIRRSGARAMLKHLSEVLGNSRALVQVQTMLDHDDPNQTLLYIGMNEEREQLNDWLRGNSMYGTSRPRAGNVIPMRRTG